MVKLSSCEQSLFFLLRHRRGKKTKRYGPKSWRIGFATPHNLDTTETELVVAKCGFIPEKVSKFFRFQLHDNIIYSCEYSRTTKANSYTVSYATEETGIFRFGMVQCFLELTRADKCSVVAIVNRLFVTSMVLEDVQHIFIVNGSLVEAIDAYQIQQKCIKFSVNTKDYIATFPHKILPRIT